MKRILFIIYNFYSFSGKVPLIGKYSEKLLLNEVIIQKKSMRSGLFLSLQDKNQPIFHQQLIFK